MWLHARHLRCGDRGGGAGVERGETREAHRVEPKSSAGRGGNATKHIIAANHVSDLVLTDEPDRGLTVELCEAHDMRAAGDRGYRRGIAERAAEWHRPEQNCIRRIQSDMARDVGGMPGDGLLIVQDQFWPTGGARGREC